MVATFAILPTGRFSDSNAAIRRPKEIACFSYDENHVFHLDERSLRYYYPPSLPADLSRGFDTFRQLDDTADDHLDSLLKTIIDFERQSSTKCSADIITWRGMITKIMATPFENMNGFEMNATRFQDSIFLEENHDYKLESRNQQHSQPTHPRGPSQSLMSFWGYKFETISSIPDQWDTVSREFIEGRENMVVENYAQYCSVVKTGIGKMKLVIGGEVDALWDRKPTRKADAINWVELKTSAEIQNERDLLKYERKLLKFWIQSFLLGVPRIIVGFRNRNGILQRLEELETKDIPNFVKKHGNGSWDGNLCINFTASFLDWLKQTITGDGVWRIRRREKAPVIEVFKIEESGHGDILPHEFVHWRTQVDIKPSDEDLEAAEARSSNPTSIAKS